jgi:hypothetical protein
MPGLRRRGWRAVREGEEMKRPAETQHYWRSRLKGAQRAHAFDLATNEPLCATYGKSPRYDTSAFGDAHSVGRERPLGGALCTLCESAVRARLVQESQCPQS